MKNKNTLFCLYPENNRAFGLSVAGGGVKILSFFLLAAAILYTAALFLPGLRVAFAGGIVTALLFIVDELDDIVFGVFFFWGAFAACRYAAWVLQEKARFLAQSAQPPQASSAAGKMETEEAPNPCGQEPAPANVQNEI